LSVSLNKVLFSLEKNTPDTSEEHEGWDIIMSLPQIQVRTNFRLMIFPVPLQSLSRIVGQHGTDCQ
ncbi:MAG: hypothetical protein AB2693_27755, partial [Candidatus Thiodiazotropha sp.]